MKNLTTLIVFSLLVAGVTLAVGTSAERASAAEPYLMKMGTATVNDHQHEWLKMFKARVEKDSKGRIKVDIYPSGQLGSIPREIEDTQFNAIQGWCGPAEFLTGIDPRLQVLAAPAIFRDPDNVYKTIHDPQFAPEFMALGADKGVKMVGIFYAGTFSVTSRSPVRSLDDLKGKKVRVLAGPIQEAQIGTFGGTGVPMPLDQVMPALQTGAIDGTFASVTVVPGLKMYTVAKYLTELQMGFETDITIISKQFYDQLPPDLQKIVVDDSNAVNHDIYPWTVDYIKRSRKAWTDGGGESLTLAPADVEKERAALVPVTNQIFKDNPNLTKIAADLQAAAARDR